MNTTTNNALAYESYSVLLSELPPATQHALMQRTYAHIMQNEASAYRGRLAAEREDDGKGNSVAKYNDAELAVAVHDWRVKKLGQLVRGELGVRASGPRLTSDEKILREIARNAIITQATAKKIALPKAADEDAWDGLYEQFFAHPKAKAYADAELARRKAAAAPEFDIAV